MTSRRYGLMFAAMNLAALAGCGESRTAARGEPVTLMAEGGTTSDVAPALPAQDGPRVAVQCVSEALLRDPMRMQAVTVWLERQIGFQVKHIPEDRYQRLVRPLLRRELGAAGLSSSEVDDILRDADYRRSL
jgi:hypothetical protein